MATTSSLIRARYAGLDFDTHLDDLRAQLQSKYANDYNDFVVSSQGIMLLDLVAFGLDSMSFYLDRRATDTYLSTARTRKAVARLTRQLGYKMRAAVSASTDLSVTIPDYSFNVTIPKGFKFRGPNELVFEAAQDVAWLSTDVIREKKVPVFEGETFTETFTSDGTANQRYTLRRIPSDKFVVAGSVTVYVNGVPFEESEFLTYEKTNQFEVGYNDDPAMVRFGDGIAGNIPTNSATISVTYVAARGKAGMVGANTIIKEVEPLVASFEQVDMVVTNPERTVGGDDPEDLNHAKIYAGKVFKSRHVAVTREDYEALAGSYADPLFGRVAAAQAISSRSAQTDTELQNLTATIRERIAEPPTVAGVGGTAIVDADTKLDTIAATLNDLDDDLDSLAVGLVTVADLASGLTTSAREARNKISELGADASIANMLLSDAKSEMDNGIEHLQNWVTGAAESAADGLTPATKTSLLDALGYIESKVTAAKAKVVTINAGAASVTGMIDSQLTDAGGITDKITKDIGTTTTDAKLLASMAGRSVAIGAASVDIRADVALIASTVTDVTAYVAATLADIETHVDKILSADGKANLVTVPILARDAAGFFAAPSIGLIRSLQSYLDSRKETTQTVIVTSGSAFLVLANVTARVGARPGYSTSVTKTAADAAVDTLLRERRFGKSLFVSDVVQAIMAVDGVAYVSVALGCPTPGKLDQDGNLIALDSEVITKGSVNIGVEIVQG